MVSILESLSIMLEKIEPAFTGTSWDTILFQLYSILCLGSYSIYRIIKVRGASVIVLSKKRLVLSTLLVSGVFLGIHQLQLRLFHPTTYGLLGKVGFVFVSLLLCIVATFHLGNAVTLKMNKIGGGPYIVQIKTEGESKYDEDFWACGQNFVRRNLSLYYLQGLYIPFLIFSLTSDFVQLVLIIGWVFSFIVMLLLRIHSLGPVLIGYFLLLYFVASRTM